MQKNTPDQIKEMGRRVLNKLIRIVEGPPVRHRTVIRKVSTTQKNKSTPCFLIGVYRSGTTLLRFVLDSHSRISVPPETNYLHQVAAMWESEWTRKGLEGVGIDRPELLSRLKEFSENIYNDYTAAKGKARWVDKTPSYVDILHFIDELFGEKCQYIMLYRHGLDVANSMAGLYRAGNMGGPARHYGDKYKNSPHLAYVKYWTDQCEKMLDFEKKQASRCFHIHYETFSNNPEKELPGLFKFLNEPWEPKVLDFNNEKHDYGLQDSVIQNTRTFKPRTNTYLAWEQNEILKAREIAGNTLSKLGYDVILSR